MLSITKAELNLPDAYDTWQIIITNNIINKGVYRKPFQSIVKLMFYFNRFEIHRWLEETCLASSQTSKMDFITNTVNYFCKKAP